MSTRWTQEEDDYLLTNYEDSDINLLSHVLDRTESAIRSRYYRIKDETVPLEKSFFLERANQAAPRALKPLEDKKGTISTSKLSKWKNGKSKRGNPFAHTKSGYRPDLGINCRSGWEANILRVLKAYDIPFEFEPTVFSFPVKRGNKAYTPDIYLDITDEWIEVKGWLDKNSQVKLKRFKIHYPEDFSKLTMIIGNSKKSKEFCKKLKVPTVLIYPKIKKHFKSEIDTWEGK